MRPLIALAGSLLLLGCPRFPDNGEYACDPATRADCAPPPVCSNGYCRVYTAPAGVTLRGIGGNASAVAVVGTGGHLAEYVDGGWSAETLSGGDELVGVAYRPGGETVVAVSKGTLQRRAPGARTWSASFVSGGGGPYLMVFERSGDVWIGRASATGPILLGADGGTEVIDTTFLGDYSDIGGTGPGEVAFLERDTTGAAMPVTRAFFSSGGIITAPPPPWAVGKVEAVFMRGTKDAGPGELVIAGPKGFLDTVSVPYIPPGLSLSADLHDIFGNSSDDFWVVGAAGTVIHYLNRSWSPIQLDSAEEFIGGWQRGPDDVWIVSRHSVFHSAAP